MALLATLSACRKYGWPRAAAPRHEDRVAAHVHAEWLDIDLAVVQCGFAAYLAVTEPIGRNVHGRASSIRLNPCVCHHSDVTEVTAPSDACDSAALAECAVEVGDQTPLLAHHQSSVVNPSAVVRRYVGARGLADLVAIR